MTSLTRLGLTAFALSAALSSAASATDYLTGGVAYYDVFDDQNATAFNLEYRGNYLFYDMIRPIVGGFYTTDGASYGYVGFNWDVPVIKNHLYIIPGFAVGAYSKGDDGKDLGGALEFRSSVEVAYQFENSHRLGISLSHLSNASLYDDNPGVELVTATYSIPLSSIFAK
ncbi:MAG: acyloxyacyl hydrolase [Rickettsiales bacterium]|nr:acyloxyacyl hydrolase [Rickettsiales bacterium]